MAWLSRPDCSLVVGHGPFQESATPPENGVAFYVQDFALKQSRPWKIPATSEIIENHESFSRRFSLTDDAPWQWQPVDAVPFSLVFQEIMAAIRSGMFEKTVPVVTEFTHSETDPRARLISAMAGQKPPLLSYGWVLRDEGFCGATPELLFSLHNRHLRTMALAGTARAEDREVFEVDEKEIREHEYVAQTLVSKLFDFGQLTRQRREILDLGSIVHFLTLIDVELHQEQSPEDLIRRLHPTPALGPLPRNDVTLGMLLKWREQLQCPAEFGAPFGLWEDGRFHSIVAIRGIWWQQNRILLPAGCGIIEASRLVNEWRELRLKRESVKHFLLSAPRH
ncbi:MAG: chorismate-binding protein [Luteolibacter sp.]